MRESSRSFSSSPSESCLMRSLFCVERMSNITLRTSLTEDIDFDKKKLFDLADDEEAVRVSTGGSLELSIV